MSNNRIIINTTPHKPRLVRIDIMVGFAMLLVVLGHLSVGFEPEWYSHGLHNWIYSFHMEMFVFLSAFLIRHTYKGVNSLPEYGQYIWRKFKKFFVWYIIIGLVVALMACFVKHIPLTGHYAAHTLRNLLLYPRWSEASFLWYIYILFGFYLISPLFFRLPQWGRAVCCIGAMFLAMVEGGVLLDTYDFCRYTFFYCLGVLCAEWITEIRTFKAWQWALMSVPFLSWSVWVFTDGMEICFEYPQLGWWSIVTGVSALPFFYLLSMVIEKTKGVTAALASISRNCYWIYLLQMFIIWGCARVVHNAVHAGDVPYWLFLVIATTLAIILPILLAELFKKVFCKK